MIETKLNPDNPNHQLLIATMVTLVDDYGYHPREVFELLDDAKRQLFHGLMEIYKEVNQ